MTASQDNVPRADSAAQLLAENPNRASATVYNDVANGILYVLLTGEATATNFFEKLFPGTRCWILAGFNGAVSGAWDRVSGTPFLSTTMARYQPFGMPKGRHARDDSQPHDLTGRWRGQDLHTLC